jgi:hypothetical protein
VIVRGVGKNHASADGGCPARFLHGTCTNVRRVLSDVLETELLRKLQSDVISKPAVDYVLMRLEEEIEKRLANLDADLPWMQRRRTALETEIRNLPRAIASGSEDVPSLRAAVVEREKEMSGLITKVAGRKKTFVRNLVKNLREFAETSMSDIRELIAGQCGNIGAMRMALAEHVDGIKLLPDGKGAISYQGRGKCLQAIRVVPRGRVELPTPAFSGPRSTGELPRHRYNVRFYGKRNYAQSEKQRSRNT